MGKAAAHRGGGVPTVVLRIPSQMVGTARERAQCVVSVVIRAFAHPTPAYRERYALIASTRRAPSHAIGRGLADARQEAVMLTIVVGRRPSIVTNALGTNPARIDFWLAPCPLSRYHVPAARMRTVSVSRQATHSTDRLDPEECRTRCP